MARNILFWLLALLITLAVVVYQRTTGPTYPVDGSAEVGTQAVAYSLTRTHGGAGDQPVYVHVPDGGVSGNILYKRYKTNDPWSRLPLLVKSDSLVGMLPHQPPAGKLEYVLELESGEDILRIPEKESIVTRFKGAVPLGVLIPHVIAMFLAMLISTRTGIEVMSKKGKPRSYALWTTGLLVIGGLILGPIVQKYAFGAYWTGFPFGTDLTDNKTLIAFIFWVIAIAAIWNDESVKRQLFRRWFVLAAAVVMLLVYLIPHSMMGSEIDYEEMDKLKKRSEAESTQSAAVNAADSSSEAAAIPGEK